MTDTVTQIKRLKQTVHNCGWAIAEEALRQCGQTPVRESGGEAVFFSPFRADKNNPNLYVTTIQKNGTPPGSFIDRADESYKGDVLNLVALCFGLDIRKDFMAVLNKAAELGGMEGVERKSDDAPDFYATEDMPPPERPKTQFTKPKKERPAENEQGVEPSGKLWSRPVKDIPGWCYRNYGVPQESFLEAGFVFGHMPVGAAKGMPGIAYTVTYPDFETRTKWKTIQRYGTKRVVIMQGQRSKEKCSDALIGAQDLLLLKENASKGRREPIVVAGGEEKMLACRLVGFSSVSPAFGEQRAPSPELAKWILSAQPSEVIVAFDAGETGAAKWASALDSLGAKVRVVHWGEGVPVGWDVNDTLKQHGPDALKQKLFDAPVYEPATGDVLVDKEGNEWDVPVPIDQVIRTGVQPFPIDCLPRWHAKFVAEVAAAYQVPVDLPALVTLTCGAVALGGKVVVRPSHSHMEALNLWTAVIMESGSRKSPPFRDCIAPFITHKIKIEKEFRKQRDEVERRRSDLESQLANAMKGASRDDRMAQQANNIREELDKLPKYRLGQQAPKINVSDMTAEAMLWGAADNFGCVSSVHHESKAFENMLGLYTGGQPNLQSYLLGYDGDDYEVDRVHMRKTETSIPYIPSLNVSLGVFGQPGVMAGAAEGKSLKYIQASGFLSRFMFSYPVLARAVFGEEVVAISDAARATYNLKISALLEFPYIPDSTNRDKHKMEFTGQARNRFYEFQNEIENMKWGDLEGMRDWAGKLAGRAARIAAIMQCMDSVLHRDSRIANQWWNQSIGIDSIDRAIGICRWSIQHAVDTYKLLGISVETRDRIAKKIVNVAKKSGSLSINKRELMRAAKASADDLDAALALLEELGHVRISEEKGKRGPSKPTIIFNPAILKQ